jgi:hypothetical protein
MRVQFRPAEPIMIEPGLSPNCPSAAGSSASLEIVIVTSPLVGIGSCGDTEEITCVETKDELSICVEASNHRSHYYRHFKLAVRPSIFIITYAHASSCYAFVARSGAIA